MTTKEDALAAIQAWWDNLSRYADNLPAKGTLAGSLVVLERLKNEYDLVLSHHRSHGTGQITGSSGNATKRILSRFGVTKKFLSEGGRTNRGLPEGIGTLLQALENLKLQELEEDTRNEILEELQRFIAQQTKSYFDLERIQAVYDETETTYAFIHKLLHVTKAKQKWGPFSEYLVGAKLSIRFPDETVENKSASTSDKQKGRVGDFKLRDAAFHVTVSPNSGHVDRCLENVGQGLHPYLIVPEEVVVGARQMIPEENRGKVSVTSIEAFVSQNVDELGTFSKDAVRHEISRLLETYNQRADEVDTDKSLLIEIPHNLRSRKS